MATPTLLKESILIENNWTTLTLTKHSGFLIAVKSLDRYPTDGLVHASVKGTRFVPNGLSGIVPAGFGAASGEFRVGYDLYINGQSNYYLQVT